jgi:hypothetical protein
MDQLALPIAALVVLCLAWFWRRSDFTIRVRDGSVVCKGKLPQSMKQALTRYLAQEMPAKRSFRVKGVWQSKGSRPRIWFGGDLTPGEQQRLRNFIQNGL